jgi:hypothetical protein
MNYFFRIRKFNPNHGPDGRFTTSNGGAAAAADFEGPVAANPAAEHARSTGDTHDGLGFNTAPPKMGPRSGMSTEGQLAAAQPKPATDPRGMYREFKGRRDIIDGYRNHKLRFVAEKEMSVDAFRNTMGTATPGGYNNYNTNRVANFLAKWNDEIKVSPGREMSPVVYVHGPERALREIAKLAKRSTRADEIDMVKPGERFLTQADVDKYHGGGPKALVPSGREWKGSVLRLWWD